MSEPTQRKPTIVVIATGGTIAMRIDPISGGPVPTLSGANLVAGIPALGDLGGDAFAEGDDGLVILGAGYPQGNDFPSGAARKLAGDGHAPVG